VNDIKDSVIYFYYQVTHNKLNIAIAHLCNVDTLTVQYVLGKQEKYLIIQIKDI
jgi:hypothetical protein